MYLYSVNGNGNGVVTDTTSTVANQCGWMVDENGGAYITLKQGGVDKYYRSGMTQSNDRMMTGAETIGVAIADRGETTVTRNAIAGKGETTVTSNAIAGKGETTTVTRNFDEGKKDEVNVMIVSMNCLSVLYVVDVLYVLVYVYKCQLLYTICSYYSC